MKITHRYTQAVLFADDSPTIKITLEKAVASKANLEGANLKGANLEGANLYGANLYGANLEGANLEGANLKGANLEGANLKGAYLEGANLKGANLKGAYLKGAYLEGAKNLKPPPFQIIPEIGAFQCFKKVTYGSKPENRAILTLQIPEDAKRTGNLKSRKCRVSACVPIGATTLSGKSLKSSEFHSYVNPERYCLTYRLNERIETEFSDDIFMDCAAGIHVFMTRQEAVEF